MFWCSSLRPVKIIRLVARYTVEDMIQCRAARKLQMAQEILEEKSDISKSAIKIRFL